MRRRGARVKTAAARCSVGSGAPGYRGQDGAWRYNVECPACHGFGKWDWRDQRRVGLSAKRGDPHMRCERCRGSGVIVETQPRLPVAPASVPQGEKETS